MRFISFFAALFLVGLFLAPAQSIAQEESFPDGYDEMLRFDSSAINDLWSQTVFVTGLSNRIAASRPKADMGTKIVRGNTGITRFEGNRVFYHLLSREGKKYIKALRKATQALPDQVALKNFHTNEQLAFWLNLRNLVVFEAVMDKYPIAKLDKFWKRLLKDKRVRVEGKRMSVGDIEAHIKANWPSPLVMYGFYNGSVGGPNLRSRAFTRENVWGYLERNGREFVNSLRGLQFDGDVAKVSELYEAHAELFPDFQKDVREHMLALANPGVSQRLYDTTSVEASVKDWYIADLYGGSYSKGSAAMVGPAAFLTAFAAQTGPGGSAPALYERDPNDSNDPIGDTTGTLARGMKELALQGHPARVQEFMKNWFQRNANTRRGIVTIQEVEDSDLPPRKEEEKEPEN